MIFKTVLLFVCDVPLNWVHYVNHHIQFQFHTHAVQQPFTVFECLFQASFMDTYVPLLSVSVLFWNEERKKTYTGGGRGSV